MRTVLVNGGSRGIGAEIVRRFCASGYRAAFTYKSSAQAAARLAEETGAEVPCFYSLSQDDVYDDAFCQCEECSKIIEKSGFSGYLIQPYRNLRNGKKT